MVWITRGKYVPSYDGKYFCDFFISTDAKYEFGPSYKTCDMDLAYKNPVE